MSTLPAPPSEVTRSIQDLHGDESVPTTTLPDGIDAELFETCDIYTEQEEREMMESYIQSLIYTHQTGGTLLPGELELVRQRIPLIA
jgi:hypothetical protein